MTDVETQDRYIALLLRSGEPEEYAAGSVVFSEGDPADRMYVVQSGSVALSIGDRRRRDRRCQAGCSGRSQ